MRFIDYRKRLERAAASWFHDQGLPVASDPYILRSRDDWRANLLVPATVPIVEGVQPLHKYVHHGLSSQAMLFNLVAPLLPDGLDALRPAFQAKGVPWPDGKVHGHFEHTDRNVFNEQGAQPTSLDLMLQGESGPPLFVEAKLAETGFGTCSMVELGDCAGSHPSADLMQCPLHEAGRRYWQRLHEFGVDSGAFAEGPTCPLALSYQFFREVLFAAHHGGHFVLLVHADNPAFLHPERGQWQALLRLLPPHLQAIVHVVTLQEVVAHLPANQFSWVDAFRQRYALDPPPAPPEARAVLAQLPPTLADAIRHAWETEVKGGAVARLAGDRRGMDGQRRISSLLRAANVTDEVWQAVIDHGRRLYYGQS